MGGILTGMHGRQMRQGLIIGALLIVALWLGSLIWGLMGKAQVAITKAHTAQADYRALEERRQKLETDIATLDTSRGRDAAIRTAFGVARPGEEVIVVVSPTVATTTPAKPWWHWLIDWW